MDFPNRKQKIGAVLMAIWLCSWIGVTLFHGLSHAAHAENESFNTTCVVCHLLDQPAPAFINAKLALKSTPAFDCVHHIAVAFAPFVAQNLPESVVPRGPPALLFI